MTTGGIHKLGKPLSQQFRTNPIVRAFFTAGNVLPSWALFTRSLMPANSSGSLRALACSLTSGAHLLWWAKSVRLPSLNEG